MGQWGLSPGQSRPILAKILKDLKGTYPHIKYLEVLNEPDYGKEVKAEDYYKVYEIFYEAVNDANTALKPIVPLQVGGPATAQFNLNWIKAFLDAFKNDSSLGKRIDFISYHGYFTKPGS